MAFNRRYATPMAIATAMAVVSLATPLAFAQQADASGEVRRVDPAAGKVTIKHDAIKALDLPAMTLVYEADPALLAKIKAGDKVKFTAERKDGKYVVTAISTERGQARLWATLRQQSYQTELAAARRERSRRAFR